ncbi:hypothetical protein Hanom_Chr05g00407951 [Helianthus anomalus]
MSTVDDAVAVEETGGALPPLKWDQGLIEQVTTADAPPGCITLYSDFFRVGNFRLPATHFLGSILHYYAFHISQLSPMGMVRIRHFEFVCRSQWEEHTVEKFRVSYHL